MCKSAEGEKIACNDSCTDMFSSHAHLFYAHCKKVFYAELSDLLQYLDVDIFW